MAKFKNQDLILDDNEQVIFGDGNDASIYWDSSDLIVNQVFKHSTQGYYATRAFVESTVAGLEWQDAVLSKVTIPVSGSLSEGDRFISPSGGAVIAFDPSNKSVDLSLSNQNFTVTRTAADGWDSAICESGKSTGKWYWEVTANSIGAHMVTGVGISTANVDSYPGGDGDSWGYYSSNGNKYHDSSPVGYGDSWQDDGDVIGIALDMDNNKIWFSKNGVWQNSGDPVVGTNEAYTVDKSPLFPMHAVNEQNDYATINTGFYEFSHSIPTGFQAYNWSPSSPEYNANDIIEWEGTTWDITPPSAGFACWVEDEGVYYIYNGSTWIKFGGVVDHGNLLGLSDDDHTQYVLVDGSRVMTGNLGITKDTPIITFTDDGGYVSTIGNSDNVLQIFCDPTNAVANSGIDIYIDGVSSSTNRVIQIAAATTNIETNVVITDHYLQIKGDEGADGYIYLYADDGDDQPDWWRIRAGADGLFAIQNYPGSWTDAIYIDSGANLTVTGDVSAAGLYGDASALSIDHGSLTGLSDDDHTIYYHTDGRRPWSGTLTVESTGSIITFKEDLAYIGVLNDTDLLTLSPGDVYIDGDLTITGTLSGDHSTLFNLDADDHTQYHNDTRGDARYYTQTQLNNGQLDTRYYTETELNNGQLDSRYYTEAETLSLTQGASANAYSQSVDYTDTEIATANSLTLEASANAYDAATDWVTAQSYLQDIVTDTSPQLGGNLDLNGKSIDYGAILTVNGTYEGDIMTVTVDDGSTAFGDVLAQGADFNYDRADADSASSSVGLVMALESGSGSKNVLIEGQICNTSWDWSSGFLYVSTTTGGMTQVAPSGSGDQVITVGWALSADTVFFRPSLILVEIA